MQLPILYSFRRCPYAMRARMALILGNAQCEMREVDLGNKPAEMLRISPKGTVPVLLFPDGTVMDESLDIMLWALSQIAPQSNVQAWLNPETGNLEEILALIERNDSEFKQHLDRYKYPDRYTHEQHANPLHHRAQACDFLEKLETHLNDSDFLFGPHASLADIAIFPFIRQFAATDKEWFASLDSPRLQAWLNGWLNSDLFAAVMHRHPVWQAGDPPIYLLRNTSLRY